MTAIDASDFSIVGANEREQQEMEAADEGFQAIFPPDYASGNPSQSGQMSPLYPNLSLQLNKV